MASTGVEGDASPGLPVESQPDTVELFNAATVRVMTGELFLGLPLSEWKRMDAVEYFSQSQQCWIPALLCGFEGELVHLNVKRGVSMKSSAVRPLLPGRYRRTALEIVRLGAEDGIGGASGEPTEDVIINGEVVRRPQCGFWH